MISATGVRPSLSTNPTANTSTGTDSSLTKAVAGGTLGKDEFVKLLVTEMKNQDPLNPMDGKELAAQLAQFSSVEQLINANTKLDNIASLLKPATSKTA